MKKIIALLLIILSLTSCIGGSETEIVVLVNAGAEDWLVAAGEAANDANIRASDGGRVRVTVQTLEAGDAAVQLADSELQPALWVPDDKVWANVAAQQGNGNFQSDCVSVAESPLVIGMWREVAGLLGWPGRSLGWLDVGSLAADTESWQYYSGGQYGESLRLGHTHPGLSASGASTLLALVHSAESTTQAISPADIAQPIVQASVGAFEGGVSWFSKDTETLGATMYERGSSFLGAGVMYENTVLAEGRGDIVPIYPFEGTFIATHPACVNSGSTSAEQAAAIAFRDWLLGPDGQQLAVTYGLRPVSEVADLSIFEQFVGVDLNQPALTFAAPSVDTIFAAQELWQTARKPVHVVLALDTSGSMRGNKIDGMLAAATQFVGQMGDDDFLTVINFYTQPDVEAERVRVGDRRGQLLDLIARMEAGGDTSLFDAVGTAGEILARNNSADTANAMVVLTDGQDTSSFRYGFDQTLFNTAQANSTTVFTIAYGRDADDFVLEQIAQEANGQFFLGTEANIVEIYDEMSAAFGGSAGIGR